MKRTAKNSVEELFNQKEELLNHSASAYVPEAEFKTTDSNEPSQSVKDSESTERSKDKPEKELASVNSCTSANTPKRTGTSRKKRIAERRTATMSVLAFFFCMLLIALFLFVIPRSKVSEIEKRQLATFPSFSFGDYFNGNFTSGITTYYDDTVPARDSFKNLGNNIKSLFGITTKGSVEIVGNITKVQDKQPETIETPEIETEAETTDIIEEETTTEENPINNKDYRHAVADASMEGGILVVNQDNHWRALPLYGGYYESLYSQTVNYVRQVVPSDVNIYVMPIPLASEFYLPANYSDYSADHVSAFETLFSELIDGITPVRIIDTLNDHNAEDIYLRTDHHWSSIGAYYATKEFAKAAGVPYPELSQYEKKVNEGYMGSMYGYTESANLLNDPEDFPWFVSPNEYSADYYDPDYDFKYTADVLFEDLPVSASYCIFLGTDDQIVDITTDVNNGRKLLVVKDSYPNAQIQFLLRSFEEIFIIDQRYFNLNLISFINSTGVTDVLFAHNSLSLCGPEAELLEYIAYNYSGAPASSNDSEPEEYYEEDNYYSEDDYYDDGYYDEGYNDENYYYEEDYEY